MRKKTILSGILLLLVSINLGWAKEPATKDTGGSDLQLDIITVTADKREVNAQDVPASITVLSDTELQDSAVKAPEELFTILPNMHLTKAGPAADIASSISVRGITQTMSGSPSFGFYIDDVYYNEYDSNLFDVERVELLRGPQGTLYGRNTIGGVLNIITKKPTDIWEGNLGLGYGNYNTFEMGGNISGPIVEDKLYIRFAGHYDTSDGFMKNIYDNNDSVNSPKNVDGRLRFRYTPSNRLTFDLGVDALKYESRYTDYVAFSQIDSNPDEANVNYEGNALKEALGGNLRTAWEGDTLNVVSITAVRKDENKLDHDMDFTPMDMMEQLYQRDYCTISEELRLLSNRTDSPLEWLVGLYGFSENQDHNLVFTAGPAMGGMGAMPINGESDIMGWAIFGQMSYTFTNQFKLTGGLRYDNEKQDVDYDATMAGGNAGSKDATFSELLPKLVISYTGSPHYTPYVSVSRGYKAGGFNLVNSAGEKFDQEYSWNYEAGVKTNWLDNRVTVNAAVFQIDWKDMQVNTNNGIDFVTTNAGEATSRGLEIEVMARPLEGLQLTGSFAYTDSTYDSYVNGAIDYSGKDVIFVPDITGSLGCSYRMMNGLLFHADYIYTGRVYMNNENTLKEDGYGLINTKIGYEMERFDIYLWAKNLFDEKYATTMVDFRDMGGGLWGRPGNPRTFGISVACRF